MGPYAGVDYRSTPESTPNTFTIGNTLKESTLTLCQSQLYSPVRDFGFGLWKLQKPVPVPLLILKNVPKAACNVDVVGGFGIVFRIRGSFQGDIRSHIAVSLFARKTRLQFKQAAH
jgi:hypothetical protein